MADILPLNKYIGTIGIVVSLFAQSTLSFEVNPQAFSGGPDADDTTLLENPEGYGMLGPKETPSADPRDFNGLWRPGATPRKTPLKSVNDVFALEDISLTPYAEKITRMITKIRDEGSPVQLSSTACRSHGIATALFPSFVMAIVQNDHNVMIMYEQPRYIQKIRLNRKHPKNLEPSYGGHSIGHWDGNTLVVETVGFNGLGELDISGAPVSENAKMIQKITKSENGTVLNLQVTIEDPFYLTEPVVVDRRWIWTNGIQQGEFDCEENPREDMNNETFYIEDLYKPLCVRIEGKGAEPSRVVCDKLGKI